MAGLISVSALQALGALTHCPATAGWKPAKPREYGAALDAAFDGHPPPYDPSGVMVSPVGELDARTQLTVGMTAWQLGRFMQVQGIRRYEHTTEHRCSRLCSARCNGREIIFVDADGCISHRFVGGDDPVPVYCLLA